MQADAMDPAVSQRLSELEALVKSIARLCEQEVGRLGFDRQAVKLRAPEEAEFHLEQDPFNGDFTLVGDWLDQRGFKQGCMLFHADGSFYLEQDIVQPHPKKKQWFVEGINAWGRDDEIKVEARLLPMPG